MTMLPYDWNLAEPEDRDLDSEVLADAVASADRLDIVHSLLVIKNGDLVLEEYFNGYQDYDYFNMTSATKSVTSTLVGIAIDKGYIQSLDQRIMDFFQDYALPGMDSMWYEVTIEHLLTMTAGIPGDNSPAVINIDDWDLVGAIFDLPFINYPGERFVYSTVQTHLLSAILTRASGMNTLRFANKHLFGPLGILVDYWDKDNTGYYYGGTALFCKPRNFARLGYLFLNGGKLEEHRIVSQDWIVEATSDKTGRINRTMGEITNVNYGYNWWIGEFDSITCYYAYGFGGQFMFCFPDLDMIVITTADLQDYESGQEYRIIRLVADRILPAVK
jgi:CubicO group peptidase (beta-lactamase class C family)